MLDFRKNEHVLITECIFPLSYTKFETETRPKRGDVLISEGARFTERILYVHTQSFVYIVSHMVGSLYTVSDCG